MVRSYSVKATAAALGVEPRTVHLNFRAPRAPALDIEALLRGALAAGRLADAVQAATPALPAYARLREALSHYRTLAGHAAWAQPLPALPRPGKLTPDGLWDGIPRLTARLQALGDLPAQAAAPFMYDPALVDGVRAFQRRHGLTDDGVIGRTTLAALQVSPAARVRQIELTMERLRWTPLMQGPRMIVINVPEFVLRAYEVVDGRIVVRTQMKVVVGKSADTRTPLFDEDLRFIEFSPYWNVPPSIARGELVPRLRRDPGHWAREGFEFVGAGGVDTVLSAAKLEAVLAGVARIRQRPGPRNALGDIKFVFPNRDNIYLHHTPSVSLFERDRRDFSHGCIRVEEPLALAKFVLQDQPGWPEARIREAMAAGTSSTLRVDAPVPVLIAYGTTLVRNGLTFFYDDIYGHDRRLDAALRAQRPKP
jgi:murein L,D-transpeptidase YcbB/YkuD